MCLEAAQAVVHTAILTDLAFEFIDVDEPLAELIANAAQWKAELTDLTGIIVKDVYLSTDAAVRGARLLIFRRE